MIWATKQPREADSARPVDLVLPFRTRCRTSSASLPNPAAESSRLNSLGALPFQSRPQDRDTGDRLSVLPKQAGFTRQTWASAVTRSRQDRPSPRRPCWRCCRRPNFCRPCFEGAVFSAGSDRGEAGEERCADCTNGRSRISGRAPCARPVLRNGNGFLERGHERPKVTGTGRRSRSGIRSSSSRASRCVR